MAELITLGLISSQDMSFGYGTFSQTLLDQTTQTLNSVNLSNFYSAYTVASSATPVFDLVNGTVQTITLTGNVTSSTFQNDSGTVPTGAVLVLRIAQDAVGGRTFVWPANVTGRTSATIGAASSAITMATLMFNGANWEFMGPPIIVGSIGLATGAITGSGTATHLPKFTGTNVLADSALYDTGNNQVLIGNTATDLALSTVPFYVSIGNSGGFIAATATTNASVLSFTVISGTRVSIDAGITGAGSYLPIVFNLSGAEKARLTTTGQFLVGTGTGSTDISLSTVPVVAAIGTSASILCANATTNASYGVLFAGATTINLTSAHSGIGTTRPITFVFDATETARFTTAGQFLVGGTSSDIASLGTSTILTLGSNNGFICATATTNSSYGALGVISGNYVQLISSLSVGGTLLPLTINMQTTEIARFKTDGSFYLGLASSDRGGGPYMISKVPYIVATGTANAEYVELGNIAGSYSYISTSHTGSGTSRPLVFGVNGTEKARMTTSGQFLFGGSATDLAMGTDPFLVVLGGVGGFVAATAATNASVLSLAAVTGSYIAIAANRTGAGTYLPMAFFLSGAEKARFDTSGSLLIHGTSTTISIAAGSVVTINDTAGFYATNATSNSSWIGIAINVAGSTAVLESGKVGGGSYQPMAFKTGGIEFMRLGTSGGLMVNTGAGALPTGGDKGAGTINVATGIYQNNTAFTNPDFVFERHYTGVIQKFANSPGAGGYSGLMKLDEVQKYAREHWQLPRIAETSELFARSERLLEKIEEIYLYLFEHEAQIKKLLSS